MDKAETAQIDVSEWLGSSSVMPTAIVVEATGRKVVGPFSPLSFVAPTGSGRLGATDAFSLGVGGASGRIERVDSGFMPVAVADPVTVTADPFRSVRAMHRQEHPARKKQVVEIMS